MTSQKNTINGQTSPSFSFSKKLLRDKPFGIVIDSCIYLDIEGLGNGFLKSCQVVLIVHIVRRLKKTYRGYRVYCR
jgi:hypothetical protein